MNADNTAGAWKAYRLSRVVTPMMIYVRYKRKSLCSSGKHKQIRVRDRCISEEKVTWRGGYEDELSTDPRRGERSAPPAISYFFLSFSLMAEKLKFVGG